MNVIGVDVSETAIQVAKKCDPGGIYKIIKKKEKLPFNDERFEIVVSTFVFMEFQRKEEMIACFLDIRKVIKKSGFFIITVNSTDLYKYHNWLSLDTNYDQNKNLTSGDSCKIKLIDINLELTDYYWTDMDYSNVAKSAGFEIIERHLPLGMESDNVKWKDELKISPCVIYVFKKFD